MNRRVKDAADTTAGAATAVDTQAALREARCSRSWNWTAPFSVGNGVDSQLAISHVTAIERDTATKLAAVIEDLLEESLSLSNRKPAVTSLLVEQADTWITDVIDLDTGDVLSRGEGLA